MLMIDGDHWPIPKKKLIDGSNLSIKNANKLLNLANELFKKENHEYGISIYLSVIAIEELGKAIMLSEASENNEKIDKNIWFKKFEHHKPKILAAVNHIRKFVEEDDPNRKEKLSALDELEKFSLDIINDKLATLYIDWNADRSDWDFFDEKPNLKKNSKARLILKHADWLIGNYSKSISERTSVIIEMIKVGLAHGHCSECNLKLNDWDSIEQHRKDFPKHNIGLKENNLKSYNHVSFEILF